MADTGAVTITSNVSQILKKMDAPKLVGPSAKALLQQGVTEGLAYLKPITPVLTGKSRSMEHVIITATSASILAPSHPLIFLERGSQAHIGPAPRSHRRKSARAFRSGMLRIKGRHFLAKTKRWTVNNLKTRLIPQEAKAIEQRFGSL